MTRLALILIGLMSFSSGLASGDYADCILENMKGISSDVAAKAIERACEEKFRVQNVPALQAVDPISDEATKNSDSDPIEQNESRKNNEAVVDGFCRIDHRVWPSTSQDGTKRVSQKNKNVIGCRSMPMSLEILCSQYEARAVSRKSKFVTVRFDINQQRAKEADFWVVNSAKGNAPPNAICNDLYSNSTRIRLPNSTYDVYPQ